MPVSQSELAAFEGKFMSICSKKLLLGVGSAASAIVQWGSYGQVSLLNLLSQHGPYRLPLPWSALNPVGLAALQQCLKIAFSYFACCWISWPNVPGQCLCQYASVEAQPSTPVKAAPCVGSDLQAPIQMQLCVTRPCYPPWCS